MTNIVTELESLDRQFSNYDKVIVPQYQRSYAWDGNNVQVFWQDIKDSIEERRDRYFIGPIVSKSIGEKEIELIDGQQRITTALALISIIRRICLFEYNKDTDLNREYYDFYNILKGRFLVTNSLISTNGTHRYQMNEENSTVFEKFVVDDVDKDSILNERKKYKKADSNYKLLDCLYSLWDFIETYIGTNSKLPILKDVAVYVLEKLQILNISVSDESDAYLIFETINDRGRELDTMDLVKNLLFSKVQGHSFEKVKNNWIRMSENLSSMSSANDFLYTFWTSYQGRTSKQNLFSPIREHIKSNSSSAINFSEKITNAARYYSAINNPSDELWNEYTKETRSNLQTLKLLSAKAVHPIIMSSIQMLDKDEFNKLLKYLVIFQVRYVLIADYHTGKYSNAVSSLPSKIMSGELNKAMKIARALKNEDVYVNDQEFLDSFSTYSCTTKKAKYILSGIEESQTDSLKLINQDSLIVNVEHVLPQTPSQFWPESETQINPSEYDTWSNRLGNMVLSCSVLNKEAKQKSFLEKKDILISESDGIKTTFELMSEDRWGKDSIENRQRRLADIAVKAWSIDFS